MARLRRRVGRGLGLVHGRWRAHRHRWMLGAEVSLVAPREVAVVGSACVRRHRRGDSRGAGSRHWPVLLRRPGARSRGVGRAHKHLDRRFNRLPGLFPLRPPTLLAQTLTISERFSQAIHRCLLRARAVAHSARGPSSVTAAQRPPPCGSSPHQQPHRILRPCLAYSWLSTGEGHHLHNNTTVRVRARH